MWCSHCTHIAEVQQAQIRTIRLRIRTNRNKSMGNEYVCFALHQIAKSAESNNKCVPIMLWSVEVFRQVGYVTNSNVSNDFQVFVLHCTAIVAPQPTDSDSTPSVIFRRQYNWLIITFAYDFEFITKSVLRTFTELKSIRCNDLKFCTKNARWSPVNSFQPDTEIASRFGHVSNNRSNTHSILVTFQSAARRAG